MYRPGRPRVFLLHAPCLLSKIFWHLCINFISDIIHIRAIPSYGFHWFATAKQHWTLSTQYNVFLLTIARAIDRRCSDNGIVQFSGYFFGRATYSSYPQTNIQVRQLLRGSYTKCTIQIATDGFSSIDEQNDLKINAAPPTVLPTFFQGYNMAAPIHRGTRRVRTGGTRAYRRE